MMPTGSNLVSEPGPAALFEDGRMDWVASQIGGFSGKNILELGPLEGAHSYMLQKGGARSVVAIEANTRAFMKCLCVKEVFNLDRVQFKLGDFVSYLDKTVDKYDLVVASGILYHLTNPVHLLERVAAVSDGIFLWTHYYDQQLIEASREWSRYFAAPHAIQVSDFKGVGARRSYKDALDWQGFAGGSAEHAIWLGKDTILAVLKRAGYDQIQVTLEHPDHPNGPAFALLAKRSKT
jgi:Protein of unknown function (DUF1698)